MKLYLQDPIHTINDIPSRLLSTSNPKRVTVYKKHLLKYILKNDKINRVNIIQQKIYSKSFKDKDLKSINNIDHDIITEFLQAEKRIKKHESSHSWPPALVSTIYKLNCGKLFSPNFQQNQILQKRVI